MSIALVLFVPNHPVGEERTDCFALCWFATCFSSFILPIVVTGRLCSVSLAFSGPSFYNNLYFKTSFLA